AGKFVLPPFQPHYTPIPEPITLAVGDTLPVGFFTNKPAVIHLSFNGVAADSASAGDSIQTTLHITTPGNHRVIATASDGSVAVADTLNFYVGGAVNIAPLPAGAQEGVNYLSGDTSVL